MYEAKGCSKVQTWHFVRLKCQMKVASHHLKVKINDIVFLSKVCQTLVWKSLLNFQLYFIYKS